MIGDTIDGIPAERWTGRSRRDSSLRVDYADVLAQAVKNERDRLRLELREEIAKIPVEQYRKNSYTKEKRPAVDFRSDLFRAIDRVWGEE